MRSMDTTEELDFINFGFNAVKIEDLKMDMTIYELKRAILKANIQDIKAVGLFNEKKCELMDNTALLRECDIRIGNKLILRIDQRAVAHAYIRHAIEMSNSALTSDERAFAQRLFQYSSDELARASTPDEAGAREAQVDLFLSFLKQ